ncbi:hypothetical protein tb265_14620 [Gemmatimonadetes bacterium T265]|nr:hypothetical protein tb265_14620 [Gemmatimonadetes bacterium T265]
MPTRTPLRTGRQPASLQPIARGRKNMRLDQSLLDAAKRALGTDNETEAVTIALQRVVANARFAQGLRAMGGTRLVDESRIVDD